MLTVGHLLNKQSFLFLLDLEVKRARRYQNYLSLLSFTFGHLNPSLGGNSNISLKTLGNLLKEELRDTDLVGQSEGNRLLVMLPYADTAGAHKVRERLEQMLQDYGFAKKGLAVEIEEVCFPTHATNVHDILRVAGNHKPHVPEEGF
ncbi:MAG: GGDEF domain-containing protein [Candidatus Hodarchaeota archaeon]